MVFTPKDHRNGMRKASSIKHRLSTADKSVDEPSAWCLSPVSVV